MKTETRAKNESKEKRKAPIHPGQPEPTPPFPKQHQDKPGVESKLQPKPRYQAEDYRAAGKLANKVALVTGGDSGIGRAVAVLFAREGADVAIGHLAAERSDADETKRLVESHEQRCLLIEGDLTDAAFCDETIERTVKEFGQLDILVSNAAHQNRKETLEEVTDEEFDRTFKTNSTHTSASRVHRCGT